MGSERKDRTAKDTISVKPQLMGLDTGFARAHVANVFDLDVQLKRRIGEDRFAQLKGLVLKLLDEGELSLTHIRSLGQDPKLVLKKATVYLSDYKIKASP